MRANPCDNFIDLTFIMATEAMRSLIDLCYDDEAMREALKDIMGFKKSFMQRFTKEEMNILEESGFEFQSGYAGQRKSELLSFISRHPECCAQDFETMIDKITYYCAKQTEMQREKKKKQRERIKELAEKNRTRTRKETTPVKKQKKSFSASIAYLDSSESSSQEDENEE